MEQVDARLPEIENDFQILRTYNSKGEAYRSIFGKRWSFEYDQRLALLENGKFAYEAGDGKTLYFTPDGAGGYISPAGYFLELTEIPYTSGTETFYTYEIADQSGAKKVFNVWGLLTDDITATGLTTHITYDAAFHIQKITSPTGKEYVFTTDAYGRAWTITQPDGGVMTYEYDAAGNLVKYTDAAGGITRYVYDSSSYMIECYDPNNNRVIRNAYDTEGRVTKQLDALNSEVTFSYTADTVTTTDAEGNVTVYTVDAKKRPIKIEYADGQVIERENTARTTRLSVTTT
jgi:YD repeat-containing protein